MGKKYHFIGIGGIGMSGLARIALKQNSVVTGSDVTVNPLIENLIQKEARVFIGHDAKYVPSDATVVYSSSVRQENPEYQAALQLKCDILHRSDLLAALVGDHKLLGVTGTHGKTTSSSLLAHVLKSAGRDPSFCVGGVVPNYQTNADCGEGEYFVAELDESDGSFQKFRPYGAIVTNIGSDHVDHYGTKENLVGAFKNFIGQVVSSDHLFWCGDNMYLQEISPPGISFGFGDQCELRAHNFMQEGWGLCFDVLYRGCSYQNVKVPLVGEHNALNVLAVFGLALSLGIDEKAIREAFLTFQGVHRRCEKKGEESGVLVIDDYAHHPTEISATLHGIRQAAEERRVIVIYQPHRYTRTRDCLGMFAGIFDEADIVYVTEIYSAGESILPGISHRDIIEEVEQNTQTSIRHEPRDMAAAAVLKELKPHDVLVTVGAGDVTKIGPQILEALKKKRVTS